MCHPDNFSKGKLACDLVSIANSVPHTTPKLEHTHVNDTCLVPHAAYRLYKHQGQSGRLKWPAQAFQVLDETTEHSGHCLLHYL